MIQIKITSVLELERSYKMDLVGIMVLQLIKDLI